MSKPIWIIYEGDSPMRDEYGSIMVYDEKQKAEEYIKGEPYTIKPGFMQII